MLTAALPKSGGPGTRAARWRPVGLAAALLVLLPWGARAAEPRLAEQVDSLVAPYLEAGIVTGMTVGILADGRQHVAVRPE